MPVKRRKKLLKVPRKKSSADRFALIEKSLKKLTKADPVSLVIKLAKDNRALSLALEDKLNVDKPAELLISDIESAICKATDFDERDVNHNFNYDYDAYERVDRRRARAWSKVCLLLTVRRWGV